MSIVDTAVPSPAPATRRFIDRRMRQLDIEPLDRARGTLRAGLWVGGGFLALLLLFAVLAPFSSAAIAPGQIVTEGDPLVVQPIDSGIVTELLVHEGQQVKRGQPLVRLDPLRSDASLSQVQARHDALLARETRLLAERDGARTLIFPAELSERAAEPAVAATLLAERTQLARGRDVRSADRALNRTELTSARAQAVAVTRQQALIGDELASYRELYDQGFARKTTVRALERNAAGLQADRATRQGAVAQARINTGRTVDAQFVDITAQLDQVRQQLAQVAPQLGIARDAAQRGILRAPADGRVSGVAKLGPGTTVGGGKTLMELVPDGAPLVADVSIAAGDIDDVRIGQPATLRFATVNPHGKTAFAGTVTRLSPDRVGDGAASGYRARITLDDPAAARRDGLALSPGIPVSANIKTQDRSLLDYLLSPFIDAMSRAFRSE